MPVESTAPFQALMNEYRARCNRALESLLPGAEGDFARLHSAMRYAVLNGGKRVRALLVYWAGEGLGPDADPAVLDAAACAVELIHAYSLVHDDLPCMDDDDLRRGKPSCHKAFDEATALLCGDALQTLAFELLAGEQPAFDTRARLAMVRELARGSGSRGMAGGQQIDLDAVGRQLDLEALERMHLHKTGALIRASVRIGALASGRADAASLERLDRYARCIGLAFQIQDDILDVEGDTATLGKASGADGARGKPTYPSLLGLEQARARALGLHHEALQSLETLGPLMDPLRSLSAYIVRRTH